MFCWPSESRTRPGPAVHTPISSMLLKVKDTNVVRQSRLQAGFTCFVTPVMLSAAPFPPLRKYCCCTGVTQVAGSTIQMLADNRCARASEAAVVSRYLCDQSGVSSLCKITLFFLLLNCVTSFTSYITKYMRVNSCLFVFGLFVYLDERLFPPH